MTQTDTEYCVKVAEFRKVEWEIHAGHEVVLATDVANMGFCDSK